MPTILLPYMAMCMSSSWFTKFFYFDYFFYRFGSILLVVCGLKLMRGSFSSPTIQYQIFTYSFLFTKYDARNLNIPGIISLFFISIIFNKVQNSFSIFPTFQTINFVSDTGTDFKVPFLASLYRSLAN